VASRARLFAKGRSGRLATVDGAAGVIGLEGDVPISVLAFTIADGRITAIDALAGPERIARLGLEELVAS
jgi:RNA polymerase sigma-70 factor (ECF subfamily)